MYTLKELMGGTEHIHRQSIAGTRYRRFRRERWKAEKLARKKMYARRKK